MSDLDDLAAARDGISSKRPGRLERVWTIHDQGRQFGPHTEHELAMMLGSGSITRDALVWRDGSPRWIPVTNLVPMPVMPRSTPAQSTSSGQVVVNITNTNSASPAPVYFAPPPTNGLGTASCILGIISVVFVCLPFVSIPLAAIGLTLGIFGITTSRGTSKPIGPSIAGVTLCGLVVFVVILTMVGIIGSMRG